MMDLCGKWQCALPDGRVLNVDVPGCYDRYIEEKDIADTVVYERSFMLEPEDSMQYALSFGAVSYYCDVYVNDILIGSHEGMWDQFALDATQAVKRGENRLRVALVKPGYDAADRIPLREVLSGFIPDVLHTFGGVWGAVTLHAYRCAMPEYHSVSGDGNGDFNFALGLYTAPQCPAVNVALTLYDPGGAVACICGGKFTPEASGSMTVSLSGHMEHPALWCIDAPLLYTYRCELSCAGEAQTLTGSFGMRDMAYNGSAMQLNGRPFYMRGVLHWGYYDDTVVPLPDDAQIARELQDIQAAGFNAVKHCLYIPSEAYLAAADKAGVLLWVELPLWLPERTAQLDERIRREYPRILRKLSGHPSVIIVSLGCELDDKVGSDLLAEMYALVRRELGVLVCDNSGSGECYDGHTQSYADFFDYHFYAELHNLEPLLEAFTPGWRNTKPWIFGEFCDSDTMRDLRDIRNMLGAADGKLQWESPDPHRNPLVALKPDFWLHEFADNLASSDLDSHFTQVSELALNHSAVHRKMTLEFTRAHAEICGYNITALRDVPLCSNGLFDDMYKFKFDMETFRSFNGPVMLLPAWDLTRIWINADRVMNKERFNFRSGADYALHVLLSNYSGAQIDGAKLRWRLTLDGRALCAGEEAVCAPDASVSEACYLGAAIPETASPETLLLEVDLAKDGEEICRNEWPVFVYPQVAVPTGKLGLYDVHGVFASVRSVFDFEEIAAGVPVDRAFSAVAATMLTPELIAYARAGGKVFLVQSGAGVLPSLPVSFWREGMVYRGYESFMNKLAYRHYADDLRFFSVTPDRAFDPVAIAATGIGTVRPLMRRYDCRRWTASDYLCEIACGSGTILATTLRIDGGQGKQPMHLSNNPLGMWIFIEGLRSLIGKDDTCVEGK